MTDAYDNGHPQGETNSNVGQDVTGHGDESSKNWEEQAKYFQSEKDKLQAENQNLKKYEQLGSMLESRPDITNAITGMLKGGQSAPQEPQRITLEKDEFDPWEAYNDPQSKSYAFRMQEMNDQVQGAVGQQMQGIKQQQGMQQLHGQLVQHGLNDEEIKSFFEFAQNNPAQYGVEGAIKMWKSVQGAQNNVVQETNPLDNIRNTQNMPSPGGLLDGQVPQAPNPDDDVWKGVLNASNGVRGGGKLP